jgi:Caspase domain
MQKEKQKIYKIWTASVLFLGIMMAFKGESEGETLHLGKQNGVIQKIIVNRNGEYVCVGTTQHGLLNKKESVFFKITDAEGKILIDTTLNGLNTEGANSLIQTADGNYVFAGFKDTLMPKEQKKQVAWLAKINKKGSIMWDLPVDSIGNSAFTDVTEALNGDLWLTGEMNKKLLVAQVDKAGKWCKKKVYDAKTTNTATRGNGMAWAMYDTRLIIVGTEVVNKQKNLLLIEFDTEGYSFDSLKTKKIINAEGNGIVRDGWGTFGIVGTDYTEGEYSDILFAHYNSHNCEIKTQKNFGRPDFDDKGWAITKETDGNFIIAGAHFANDRDKKSEAWLHKLSANGIEKWTKPKSFGSKFNDGFKAVVVPKNGQILVAGSQGNKPWLFVAFDESFKPNKPSERLKNIKKDTVLTPINVDISMDNVYKPTGKDSITTIGLQRFTLKWKVTTTDTNWAEKSRRILVNGQEYKEGIKGDNVRLDSTLTNNGVYSRTFREDIFLEENAKIVVEVTYGGKTHYSNCLRIRINRPNLYVLTIGVASDLNYTEADAKAVLLAFKSQEIFYKKAQFKQLTTKDSTTAGFMRQQISTFFIESQETDVVILFISSHGSVDINKNATIWGSDYDTSKITTYLNYTKDIDTPLRTIKGKKYVLIDACRNPTTKGISQEDASAFVTAIANSQPAFRHLLSCNEGQFSYEDTCLEQGIFTYALLEALRNKPRDCYKITPQSSLLATKTHLTFKELSGYLEKRVPNLSNSLKGKNQTPRSGSNKQNQDNIPFFIFQD